MLYVFDVNETLLDLAGLDDTLGGEQNRCSWFDLVIRTALVCAATGAYRDFADLAYAAARHLEATGTVPNGAPQQLAQSMRELRPHPDVLPALDRLREQGHRLVVLGNSPRRVLDPQLQAAGITALLHARYSVEQAGALKPSPAPYRLVLEHEHTEPHDATMVAAHGWDVAGATAAGMGTVLLRREPPRHPDLTSVPDRIVTDLRHLATPAGAHDTNPAQRRPAPDHHDPRDLIPVDIPVAAA